MLNLITAAHILLGIVWMVGTLILVCVVYPRLARKPAAAARERLASLARTIDPPVGAAGGLTLLIGPLRAYLGGGITTLGDLAHPYAHLVITAFVLVLLSTILGGRFRRKYAALTADPTAFAAKARSMTLVNAVIQTVILIAILADMIALGSGSY